jgi:hypothetical protein
VKTIGDYGQQLHVEAVGKHRGERLGHVSHELVFAANRLDAGQAVHHLKLEVVGERLANACGIDLVKLAQESDSGSVLFGEFRDWLLFMIANLNCNPEIRLSPTPGDLQT